jgi:hypothetical protein
MREHGASRESTVRPRIPRIQLKQPEPKVKVTVVAIMASDRCKCIDPRLKEIAAELQSINKRLTGFSVASITEQSLLANEKGKFACLSDACVEVVIQQCVDKNGVVCLGVKAPLQNELVYKSVCGKFFLLVTRYQAPEQIPPMWIAKALSQSLSMSPAGPLMAVDTLMQGRTRARLIIAVRAEPCLAK